MCLGRKEKQMYQWELLHSLSTGAWMHQSRAVLSLSITTVPLWSGFVIELETHRERWSDSARKASKVCKQITSPINKTLRQIYQKNLSALKYIWIVFSMSAISPEWTEPGTGKLFYKRPNRRYFRLCGPYGLREDHSHLPLQRESSHR